MSDNREIKVPSLGESVSEATIARWLKKAGEFVVIDEVLVELETDKVTLEITSPATGVLSSILKEAGMTVEIGSAIGNVAINETMKGNESSDISSSLEIENSSIIKQATAMDSTNETLAPAVRRLVVENDLNPDIIPASGKDKRLTKGDILSHLNKHNEATKSIAKEDSHLQANDEKRIKMSRLRQRISERLKYAQNNAAILTTFNEVDMSAVNKIRLDYKDKFEKKYGVKIGFMSFFIKAAIQALKEIPAVNGEIDGEEIIYKNYYDIGVAISAPQGLVVPVLQSADKMTFAEIEAKINELGIKAKENRLSIEEMRGGTFTISNGGVFGSLMSTPILNPPQSGILGMHKIQDRPVVIDGKIEIRPMMYLALSYDHRLIDGREAVTFLVKIKENIENPERILLEI